MATPLYPDTLPMVTMFSGEPDRQVISTDGDMAPVAYRRRSRVPGALDDVTWVLVNDQMKTFRDWWRDVLLDGHRWFYIKLPSAGGLTWHVARFADENYQSRLLGHRAWNVSAKLEIRERPFSEVVFAEPGFLEDFESGLGNWVTTSGDGSLFTLTESSYGDSLNCAAQNSGTYAQITRSIGSTVSGSTFRWKFKVTTFNADDAATLYFYNGVTSVIGFNPAREAVFDGSRRPRIVLPDGDLIILTDSDAVIAGDWYQLKLLVVPGAGNSSITITHISSGTEFAFVNPTHDYNPTDFDFDTLKVTIDSAGLTCPTQYDDIQVI